MFATSSTQPGHQCQQASAGVLGLGKLLARTHLHSWLPPNLCISAVLGWTWWRFWATPSTVTLKGKSTTQRWSLRGLIRSHCVPNKSVRVTIKTILSSPFSQWKPARQEQGCLFIYLFILLHLLEVTWHVKEKAETQQICCLFNWTFLQGSIVLQAEIISLVNPSGGKAEVGAHSALDADVFCPDING